ncbi:hypothetical protein BDW59DRAFT_159439 [Aspergillus cavernicola]|uniref:Uncharacterized protein n=1 Tax=Aspergillus cavernicola TaxID=176166 RepID=A0ABR4ILI3_9EURO
MSSSILHSCPFCGHVTDISEVLADFVGNPHCTQCGLSASEGSLKQQDDLVALFNTHMNMEPPQPLERKEIHPPITYSITQHYHHSAHVVQKPAAGPMQSIPVPVTNETANWVYQTLRQYNVDPSSLTSSQLELFANAMPEQQSRLIQMWQICPEPSASAPGFTQSTQIAFAKDSDMCDSSQEQGSSDHAHQGAEPYMLSGYELVAHESSAHQAAPMTNEPTTGSPYRPSSDPVYQVGGQRWWERTQAGAMEC